MIVSASYRTDIPALYADWFAARLDAGFADVTNPYGGRPYRVSLEREQASGFVFWTRNAAPFMPVLARLMRARRAFYCSFTLTGNGRALERSVIDAETAIGQMRRIVDLCGAGAVVWRYDPIVATARAGDDGWMAMHLERFGNFCAALRGYVDECVVSFMQPYAKTRRNMNRAAREGGFAWHDPPLAKKAALLGRLADIAHSAGIGVSLCSQPELQQAGIPPARCIDADRLRRRGAVLKARVKGNRPGCLCHESRDIGAYDSCVQGCAYCYAVSSRRRAAARLKTHDPAAPML